MSFPKSSRFSEYLKLDSPSPATYNLPSEFQNTSSHCSSWVKPCPHGHKCTDNCSSSVCTRNSRDILKKSLIPSKKSLNQSLPISYTHSTSGISHEKRALKPMGLSLNRNQSLPMNKMNSSLEGTQKKRPSFLKPTSGLQKFEEKENVSNPYRRNCSSIPRVKKSNAERQAPSLMTRPRNIHNCFYTIEEQEKSPLELSNFNRHSTERKSVKPIKRNDRSFDNIDKNSKRQKNDSNLTQKRPFNVSYTVIPKTDEQLKKSFDSIPSLPEEDSWRNVDNITDDMKDVKKTDDDKIHMLKRYKSNEDNSKIFKGTTNLDLDTSIDISKTLTKKDITKTCTKKNKTYYEIVSEMSIDDDIDELVDGDRKESEVKACLIKEIVKKPRCRDIFALGDCNMIFLVNEEFIDDDYDSYINGLNRTKGYKQVLRNKELYEMTKYLVNLYLERGKVPRLKSPQSTKKTPISSSTEKGIRTKFVKLFNKGKKSNNIAKKNIWKEIEAIVRSAITELKVEFQAQIYKTTSEKLNNLVNELRNVVLKANEDIGDSCEHTAVNLISKLENLALKS